MKGMTKLTLAASALELLCGVLGFVLGGFWAGIAALIGASLASMAQVAAVAMLRPAMRAKAPAFQQRWVLGMAMRGVSFVAFAAVILLARETLPPLWLAAGYLGTMLVLLFAETLFLT